MMANRQDRLKSTTALSGTAPIRVVLYGRYSSDLQNPKSVEAQFLICREYAARQLGWQIVDEFRDEAVTGTSLIHRPGMRNLLDAAMQGKFDIVLSEALDRVSRDDVDMPYIARKLRFASVKIFTVADNEVTKILVGMRGTMNSVFIDDLKEKTHRGLEFAVAIERKVIGRAYGYETVREFDPQGNPVRGLRRIKPHEAAIVVRILTEYANGRSPYDIAVRLGEEGIPGPTGKEWCASTIRGDARRGTGMINNEIYIGKIVWNRTTHPQHPDTRKAVNRANSREEWVMADAPELRIVSDELWDRVKKRQAQLAQDYASVIAGSKAYADRAKALVATHRPNSLLSGLMVCGICGGPFTSRGQNRFGCKHYRWHGSCSNTRTITRDEIEERVLSGLRGPLLDQVNIDKAVQSLIDETDRLNRERRTTYEATRKSLVGIEKEIGNLVAAVKRGAYSESLNKALSDLEAQKRDAESRLATDKPTEVCIPKNFAEMLRRKIDNLPKTLRSGEECTEAIMLVRELISRVVIFPNPNQPRGKVVLKLYGCLGTLLDHITGATTAVMSSVESGAGINRWHHTVVITI